MEFQESFSLELSFDGGAYNSMRIWVSGTDFVNDHWTAVIETLHIPSGASFASVRFICNALSNFDMVFIDDIIIGICFEPNAGGDIPFVKTQDFSSLVLNKEEIIPNQQEINMSVFSNPSSDYIGFSLQNTTFQHTGLTISI